MDYRIEAFEILLDQDCILERYYPLVPYKARLINNLKQIGCMNKSQCMLLDHERLLEIGLPDLTHVNLFRRYLVLYDVKPSKFKDIGTTARNEAEASALRELYLLPGVKSTRALLYIEAGYSTLERIASSSPEEIIQDTSALIARKNLNLKAPLPKEVRTHIAVARALTEFSSLD